MKKFCARFLTMLFIVSILCAQASATSSKPENTNRSLSTAEANMMDVINALASGEINPCVQDNTVQFSSQSAGTSNAVRQGADVLTDVRLVGLENGIATYQATYITRANQSKYDEDIFGETKVYLSVLYSKIQNVNDNVTFAHIVNAKTGSIDIGSSSVVKNLQFGIYCRGYRCSSSNSSISYGSHNQKSSVIATVPADAGYSLYDTDPYYYAMTDLEGTAGWVRYDTSTTGSNRNAIFLKLGLDDWDYIGI